MAFADSLDYDVSEGVERDIKQLIDRSGKSNLREIFPSILLGNHFNILQTPSFSRISNGLEFPHFFVVVVNFVCLEKDTEKEYPPE